MYRTAGEIEADVFAMLTDSALKDVIGGGIYRSGMRPLDAKTEDAVVVFLAGDAEQVQTGKINVNVYVPDINIGNRGVWVKNTARCTQIEGILRDWTEAMAHAGRYWFAAESAVKTFEAADIKQHFVNLKLKFKYFTI